MRAGCARRMICQRTIKRFAHQSGTVSGTEDLAVYPPTSLSGFDDIVSLVVTKWHLLPPFDRYGSESRTLAGWRRTF